MARVAPSERFRAQLDEVLAGVGQQQDPVETIGRLGARLILQQALEDEVTESLGRRPYERSEAPISHRNGYEPRRVTTTSGSVELEPPRLRDASKLGFESRILGRHVTRTYALESLVITSFLRGLSTRDVEAVLEETFDEPISSRSTVSRILEDTASATGAGAPGDSRATTSSTGASSSRPHGCDGCLCAARRRSTA